MKTNFLSRLGAYFIDVIIIGLVVTVITGYIPTSEKYEKLIDEQNELLEKYSAKDIEYDEYFKEYSNISYEITKANILTDSIGISIGLLYFILLTYFNNGRTIGKLMIHSRVTSKKGKLSILTVILRSLLVTGYFTTIINMILINVLSKSAYLDTSMIVESIGGLFVIVSGIMILYRKDKCGLHDLILNTEVVKEDKVL